MELESKAQSPIGDTTNIEPDKPKKAFKPLPTAIKPKLNDVNLDELVKETESIRKVAMESMWDNIFRKACKTFENPLDVYATLVYTLYEYITDEVLPEMFVEI